MNYILFVIYLVLACWLLTKSRFISNAGIGIKILIGIFLLKVGAGMVNGWLSLQTSYVADTWLYHYEGLKEYQLLFNNPVEYFSNLFRSGYTSGYAGLFESKDSYWNDLKSNLIIKLLSVFDIFSRGNYYINVIFYNFIVLFGNVALYKVFSKIYKGKEKLLLVTCFLLPSLLYFSSSIHKEGLILCAVGIIVYNIYYALEEKNFTVINRISYIVLCLFFIFLQRNFIFIAILPAAIAWLIAVGRSYAPLKVFVLVYIIGTVAFFTLGYLSPKLNLPAYVVKKQEAFLLLEKPASFIAIDSLSPTFTGFVRNAPQALDHALLRPFIFESNLTKFLYPLAAELLLYLLLFLLFLFFRKPNVIQHKNDHSFILFGLFFSLSVLLIIGYTIPVTGAIVRYRSIYLPFLLTPFLAAFDTEKLKKTLRIKK